jgi:hypothetical protein
MAAVRYADDFLALSRMIDRGCLHKLLHTIYGDLLQFSVDDDFVISPQAVSCVFLDFVVYYGFTWIRFGHAPKAELLVLTSDPQHMKRHSFRPFSFSNLRSSFSGWRADLSGRRARWSQLSLDPAMLSVAVIFDVVGMHFSGYPIFIIRRLWDSQNFRGLDCSISSIVLDMLTTSPPYMPNFPILPLAGLITAALHRSSSMQGYPNSGWQPSHKGRGKGKGKGKGQWSGPYGDYNYGGQGGSNNYGGNGNSNTSGGHGGGSSLGGFSAVVDNLHSTMGEVASLQKLVTMSSQMASLPCMQTAGASSAAASAPALAHGWPDLLAAAASTPTELAAASSPSVAAVQAQAQLTRFQDLLAKAAPATAPAPPASTSALAPQGAAQPITQETFNTMLTQSPQFVAVSTDLSAVKADMGTVSASQVRIESMLERMAGIGPPFAHDQGIGSHAASPRSPPAGAHDRGSAPIRQAQSPAAASVRSQSARRTSASPPGLGSLGSILAASQASLEQLPPGNRPGDRPVQQIHLHALDTSEVARMRTDSDMPDTAIELLANVLVTREMSANFCRTFSIGDQNRVLGRIPWFLQGDGLGTDTSHQVVCLIDWWYAIVGAKPSAMWATKLRQAHSPLARAFELANDCWRTGFILCSAISVDFSTVLTSLDDLPFILQTLIAAIEAHDAGQDQEPLEDSLLRIP